MLKISKYIIFFLFSCYTHLALSENNVNDSTIKILKGSYDYSFIDSDKLRGREEWIITTHNDGSKTLQSFVDLWQLGHQTNVLMRVNKNFVPIDAFINFWRSNVYGGAVFLWAETSSISPKINLNSKIISPSGNADYNLDVPTNFSLRLHPVITEGWHVAFFDKSITKTKQLGKIYNVVTKSDETLKGIGILQDNIVDYKGTEVINVPAGKFKTDHFTFYDGRYDIWLWSEDKIIVLYKAISNNREYRLTNIDVSYK